MDIESDSSPKRARSTSPELTIPLCNIPVPEVHVDSSENITEELSIDVS